MKKVCYLISTLMVLLLITNSFADAIGSQVTDTVIPVKSPDIQVNQANSIPFSNNARLWNLQDADILSVINEVSLETGKNFVVDPRVTGKITLISSKPIKPNEVYDVFLSVLALLGYSAIPNGNVVKIVPNMESSEYATRVASRLTPGRGDEVVVRVIPLENVSANQLIPVIRPLLPQWSNITAYTPGNVLILVGRAANLQRILTIINNIERASDNSIEIVSLHQASAAQMANVLNNLQNASRAAGDTTQISIAPDERSNSILLSGNRSTRLHYRFLITQLDTPNAGASGSTEVIYLRYLMAKNFAPILGKIAQNLLGKESKEAPIATASATVFSPNTGTAIRIKESENLTNIQAEPSTNSLIITAPPAMMRALNDVVAKLDIRPAQVLIEGILVELNQDDLLNLGIQWGALTGPTTPALGPGFIPFGEGVVGIIPHQQIQAVLSMLENLSNVNVLATPSVVVLDNHRAKLNIGQQVPVTTGSYATSSNQQTANPFTTTGYKDVSLVLDVLPQINLGNSVRLTVNIKNDTLQNPDNPGPTPLINTSQIINSVIVDSCDILVIGGLIRNSVANSIDKIPYIGDIPIVGLLFQHHTRKLEKRNLVVFLKPQIMHNAAESNAITNTKYDITRHNQINWPVDFSAGGQKEANVLPLWRNNTILPKPFC